MRRLVTVAPLTALCILLALGMVWCQSQPGGDAESRRVREAAGLEAPPVVATVFGEPITRSEFENELVLRAGPLILVRLIDEAIIRQIAATAGVTAAPERVEVLWRQAWARAGSEEDLTRLLEQQGRTPEGFRRELEVTALWDELARQEVQVSEDEIAAYYQEQIKQFTRPEQVRLLLYMGSTKENAEAFAAMLEAGGDFAALAREVSEDPATRGNGGETGWIGRDDYAKAITDVAFALKPGQTSDLIATADGWVIIRILERREGGPEPLDQVRDQVRQRVAAQKLAGARRQWLLAQRAAARLTISDEQLGAAVRALLRSAPGPGELTFFGMPPGLP